MLDLIQRLLDDADITYRCNDFDYDAPAVEVASWDFDRAHAILDAIKGSDTQPRELAALP